MNTKLDKNYVCPKCNAYLRVWNNVIFSFRSKTSDKKGIILLNADIGNYDFLTHSSINFNKGEELDIFCPVCFRNLGVPKINKNLVKVNMIDEEGKVYRIFFSRVIGEQLTIVMENENIVESQGKDSTAYLDYFLSRWELQKTELV